MKNLLAYLLFLVVVFVVFLGAASKAMGADLEVRHESRVSSKPMVVTVQGVRSCRDARNKILAQSKTHRKLTFKCNGVPM